MLSVSRILQPQAAHTDARPTEFRAEVRMRSIVAVLVALITVSLATAFGQALSDADIQVAIKAGESKKFDTMVSTCNASPGFGEGMGAAIAGGIQRNGSFNVVVSGNAGRVAALAADAKRMYRSFTIDNMTDELRTPSIFVSVDPQKPSSSGNLMSVAAPIEHVVLKSKARPDAVIQPASEHTEPVEWGNLVGGKIESNRAVAIFDYATVKELPPGEFDVVVITPQGERRCKVGVKDRVRLFPSK
jgi:hypothetical protein